VTTRYVGQCDQPRLTTATAAFAYEKLQQQSSQLRPHLSTSHNNQKTDPQQHESNVGARRRRLSREQAQNVSAVLVFLFLVADPSDSTIRDFSSQCLHVTDARLVEEDEMELWQLEAREHGHLDRLLYTENCRAAPEEYLTPSEAKLIELRKEMVRLSRAPCANLCEEMQVRLPRELRDIVYGYLLDGESGTSIAVCRGDFRCGCTQDHRDNSDAEDDAFFEMAAATRWSCSLDYYIVDRKLFNTEYLGKETLREVAGTWYSIRVFKIHDWRYTELFVHTDVWELGMSPTDYISTVHFHLSYSDLRKLQSSSPMPGCMRFGGKCNMLERLQHLANLREGARVCIKIGVHNYTVYSPECTGSQAYQSTLKALFSMLKQFEQQGLRILVIPL
jgi:hypothetical protein